MKKLLPLLVALLTTLVQAPEGRAQTPGTLTVALQQNVDVNGRPLAGCLLYIYIAGTVGSPQAVYTDPGLSVLAPNPLTCDQTGRVPMFYLGASSVHVRLTDAFGVQVYDYSSMIVLGQTPTGSGGGGGAVDPTTVAATGDMKFRASSEVLAGWVTLNGTTIGSATSGGTQRANADTQALFQYLWANCFDPHCPVSGGRGGTAAGDFGANKTIQVPDFRGRTSVGLDSMGATAANRLVAGNITSGGGDGINTPNATGGESMHTLTMAEMPIHSHTITDPGHSHTVSPGGVFSNTLSGALTLTAGTQSVGNLVANTNTTGINGTNTTGSGNSHNNMPPLMLGSWYMKLATPENLHICDMLTCKRHSHEDI